MIKILVVGDLMLDHYIWGSCDRISPEAPVQVVKVQKESYLLGGAGNVVRNLVQLGASVSVASVLGDDEAGEKIKNALESINADTSSLLIQRDRESSIKSRIMASHQQVIRFDKESADDIKIEGELFEKIERNLENFGAVFQKKMGFSYFQLISIN